VFSPRLAVFVLDAFASISPKDVDPELDQLTDREQEVLPAHHPGSRFSVSSRPRP